MAGRLPPPAPAARVDVRQPRPGRPAARAAPPAAVPGLRRPRADAPARPAGRSMLRSGARNADRGGGHRALSARAGLRPLPAPGQPGHRHRQGDPARRAGGPAFFNSFRSGPNIAARGPRPRQRCGRRCATRTAARASRPCRPRSARSARRRSGTPATSRATRNASGAACARSASRRSIPTTASSSTSGSTRTGRRGTPQHAPLPVRRAAVRHRRPTDWTPVWSLTRQRHRLLPTGAAVLRRARQRPGQRLRRLQRQRGRQQPGGRDPAGAARARRAGRGRAVVVQPQPRCRASTWPPSPTRGWPNCALSTRDWAASVWVLDVTVGPRRADHGRGVPAHRRRAEDIMFGFGAHLDPRIAVRRAVTELNQMMPAVLAPGADGGYALRRPGRAALVARPRPWPTSRTCCPTATRRRAGAARLRLPPRRRHPRGGRA